MSTPGNLTIVDKTYPQTVPATGAVDGGTLLHFRDDADGFTGDRWALPVGDTLHELQVQAVFSNDVTKRPTWVQVELVRIVGTTYDTTGKSRRSVVQPGTTTWADTFVHDEYVDESDGLYGWTVTHNGDATIKVEVQIAKHKNVMAQFIHRLGGFNRWSDGTIR